MRYINHLMIALASALVAVYTVLWLTKPSPIEDTTIPPLIFKQDQAELTIWGGWDTVEGYRAPGTNAIEVRCNRDRNSCSEAVATILHHTAGEDIESQVYNYRVVRWDETGLEAVAEGAMGLCLERRLAISLKDRTAALTWAPPAGCEGDTGRAVLVGDSL
jgi:hypothetical protein